MSVTLVRRTACAISGIRPFKMAPKKKKRKLSKAERKQLQVEKGKKGAESRGVGLGSRKSFDLGENWREEPYKSCERTHLRLVSPGKTKYTMQTTVKQSL